jgi:hypothetical protein
MHALICRRFAGLALALMGAFISSSALCAQQATLGIFDGQQDVGTILHPGSAVYDASTGTYTLTGSGDNIWWAEDDFHYVWKKVSGDFSLSADIALPGTGGEPHRKAVIMIRQTLDQDSAAVSLAVHGDGLTSLQWRLAKGDNMHEVQANVNAPATVRVEKHGDYFSAFVTGADGKVGPSGAATKVVFTGPFYVGIGVCAHNKVAIQRATFSNVKLMPLVPGGGTPVLISELETISIDSTDRHVEYVAQAEFEAPNWTRDGSALLFNQDGKLRRFALGASEPTMIDMAPETQLNNDHGISPDGTMLAFSDTSNPDQTSRVFVAPIGGGTPRQVSPDGPSYWHGWSPDGKTLAYTALRNGNDDVYIVPAAGGPETRLTTAEGLDDGPDYSPDGEWIYFNSVRTGRMQIWRMKPDGSGQEHVLSDETNDWFPHISPDGKWMVFLAFAADVKGHPPEKDVALMLMSMADKKVHVLTTLFGGQGTINVPSWSPDSKRLALMSYELLPADSLTR